MTKKELLLKVKFIEKALIKNEELSLVGIKVSSKMEYFLISTEAIDLLGNNVYVILNANQLVTKELDISHMEIMYCKCELFDFENECTCNIPSREELEKEWYNGILSDVKARVESILK